jgi:hypothetical protein
MRKVIILSILLVITNSAYSQNNKFSEPVLDSIVTTNLARGDINKSEYEYDDINNQLIEHFYIWDNNANTWIGNRKYEYDNNNNRILYILYLWDTNTNTWAMSHKYEYEVDDANHPILYVLYYWDSDSWKEITKIKYDYDTSRNPISYISYSQSIETDEWTKYGRNEVYYDANNMELYVCYSLDRNTNAWINGAKIEYEYDTDNKLMLTTQHSWDSENNAWMVSSESQYYYSTHSTSDISTDNLSNITVFPNPTTNYITIRGAESSSVTIFDLGGRAVYQQNHIGKDETISVSTWTTGTYLVVIQTGNEKIVHKIVKK